MTLAVFLAATAVVSGCVMVDGSCRRHATPWAPPRPGCAYLEQIQRDAAGLAARTRRRSP